jgi:hypothetical protein
VARPTEYRHERRARIYGSGAMGAGGAGVERRSAPVASPRQAWVDWVSPRFGEGAAYFTGTYGDEYGFSHGLMLARNVHNDFRRFLKERDLLADFICGVEQHRYRDILHLHAVLAGEFSQNDRLRLKAEWALERGHARVLPVLDGCASYVTKYALKGDCESFDWRLS